MTTNYNKLIVEEEEEPYTGIAPHMERDIEHYYPSSDFARKLGWDGRWPNWGKVISLDPSSTCLGWCRYAAPRGYGLGQTEPGHHGVIRPPSRLDSYLRIDWIVMELHRLLDDHQPAVILIESTTAKVGAGMRQASRGAGLQTYGAAVRAVYDLCRLWRRTDSKHLHAVVRIPENLWTNAHRVAGRISSKAVRQLCFAAANSWYDEAADRGGDAADACMLAEWFYAELSVVISTSIRSESEGLQPLTTTTQEPTTMPKRKKAKSTRTRKSPTHKLDAAKMRSAVAIPLTKREKDRLAGKGVTDGK